MKGVREFELSRSLTKALPSILSVVKRPAPPKKEVDKSADAEGLKKGDRLPERVQPSRRGKPSDLKEGGGKLELVPQQSKAPPAKKGGKTEAVADLSFGPWEESVDYTTTVMEKLAERAAASKVRLVYGVQYYAYC